MQERYLATVDLGSGKIALCVARVTGRNISIIYYRQHPSAGIRHSCVYNPAKAAEALRSALDDAERELDISILQVVVGLPRYSVSQEIASARLDCNENICISDSDTDMVKNEALSTYPLKNPETETIYGAITQSFSTDELLNAAEDDVIGTTSKFLDGNFKVFVGPRKAISNIDTMLQMAEVSCAAKMFLPDATARAILSESELDNGAALIEMGAGVSSLTIYQGNIMRHYCAIPFAGRAITNDIKFECGFQESLAENIKMAWGACMPEKLQNMSEKILQINDDSHGTYEHLSVKYLSEIISARAREIIEALTYSIHDSGFGKRLRCGIVLTGGCAELTNLAAYIHDLTGFNVRTGYPHSLYIETGDCTEAESPEAAASIGMLLQAAASLPKLDCLESAPIIKPSPVAKPAVIIKPSPAAKPADTLETEPGAAGTPAGDPAAGMPSEEPASRVPATEEPVGGERDAQESPAGEFAEGPAEIFRPEDLRQNLFHEFNSLEQMADPVATDSGSGRKNEKKREPKPARPKRQIRWGTSIRNNLSGLGQVVESLFDNIDE